MLQHQVFRTPAPGEPLILAAFSYRYDAHLVPDMLENIRPGVHGYVAWDDRASPSALSDEPTRRAALFEAAKALGAQWLLTPDPDERIESGFAGWLPELIAEGDRFVWSFSTREMFDSTHFRTDGPWGGKSKVIFFPIGAARVDPAALLHAPRVRDGDGFQLRDARINLYHLRMASPARRQLRRDLYAAADPQRRFQLLGYDYLADERGMILEPIPEGRGFQPPFVDDHGLWSPDPGALGDIHPDPYAVRLARVAISARRRARLSAHHVLQDLFSDSPQDNDLRLLSARFALEAKAFATAATLATDSLTARPRDLYPRLLRAAAHLGDGNADLARPDLKALSAHLPDSPLVAALVAEADRPTANFAAEDAVWRAQAPPDAHLHEGGAIARSDLATVVLGFRSQPGLLAAVQSLLDQDHPTEIVVVNSGGGTVAADLAPVAGRIRLITCDTPLYVGAARNIGIEASRAPYIAFLAGDCIARPGWVSGRLARHRAGAATVSTAVIGEPGAGLVAMAANRLSYATRNPDADPRSQMHYGLSCERRLFGLCGGFPPGLPVAEDTALNRLFLKVVAPVWAPEVATVHRDPADLLTFLRDERRRGQRRAGHAPFRDLAALADPTSAVALIFQGRLSVATAFTMRDPALSDRERRAVLALQWLASQAGVEGTLAGLSRIAKANALGDLARDEVACAHPSAAITQARKAWALDPEDPAKARQVGDLCQVTGDPAGAILAYRAALAIDPADSAAGQALTAIVAAQQGDKAALAVAEGLALAAPTQRRHWDNAAHWATRAGLVDWAVALGQIGLGLGVARPGAHQRLSHLHLAAGNPTGAAFRTHSANRLSARAMQDAGARKA